MSGNDRSADIDIPSQCPECGSVRVIYDCATGEIACQQCGTAVQLGTQKSDAVRLLSHSHTEFTPRQLLLEWYRRSRLYKAEKAQLEAKHLPDLQRLENQVSRSTGLTCRICRGSIMRNGKRGAFPQYCEHCRKEQRLDSEKRYRANHPDRVMRTKRNYRKKIRKTGGQAGKESTLGSKPLRPRDLRSLRALGHYRNSVVSPREIPQDE